MTERDIIILVPEGEEPKNPTEYMFKTVGRIGEKEYDVYSDDHPTKDYAQTDQQDNQENKTKP